MHEIELTAVTHIGQRIRTFDHERFSCLAHDTNSNKQYVGRVIVTKESMMLGKI